MRDKHRLVNPEENPERSGQAEPMGVRALAGGQVLDDGRYTLIRSLGRGGMGVVWLAKDRRLGEEVALKLLPPEIAADPVALDDLRRETLKSRKLTHPNIVRIHDLHEKANEGAFISMEYIDGPNLVTLRREQPDHLFKWEFLRPMVKQLCDALEYAHSEKVIHRDLKPANMMLDQRGRFKLADFGIAAMLLDSAGRVSMRHLSSGTPNYMSPQQMAGQIPRAADDIYGLGATLYELLASQTPFRGDNIVEKVTTLEAQSIRDRLLELHLTNEIPAEVEAVIMSCLAKDPAQRPQSAREFASRIGLELTAIAPRPAESEIGERSPLEVSRENENAGQPGGGEPSIPAPRSGTRWGLAVALLLISGILAGFLYTKRLSGRGKAFESVVATRGNSPGSPDMSFDPGSGIENAEHGAVLLQGDGKIVVAGKISRFNDIPRNGMARLNPDGTLDRAVNPVIAGAIHDAAVQPDGKIVIVGDFRAVNGVGYHSVARLNPDLSIDGSFKRGAGGNRECRCVTIQGNGKIVIGGSFVTFHGAPRQRLVRLNADGSLDAGFDTASGADQMIWTVASQPDNRVIAGGRFKKYKGVARDGVARVNENGTLDPSLNPDFGGNCEIKSFGIDSENRILVGGTASKANTLGKAILSRFLANGVPDPSFDGSAVAGAGILAIVPRQDGKIILAGGLATTGNPVQMGITQINSNGSLDTRAPLGAQIDGAVWSIAIQPDGRIVVYGSFNKVGTVARRHIARLYGVKP